MLLKIKRSAADITAVIALIRRLKSRPQTNLFTHCLSVHPKSSSFFSTRTCVFVNISPPYASQTINEATTTIEPVTKTVFCFLFMLKSFYYVTELIYNNLVSDSLGTVLP